MSSAAVVIGTLMVNGYSGKCITYNWPQGYKTFFMLDSTEHEIPTAHNN